MSAKVPPPPQPSGQQERNALHELASEHIAWADSLKFDSPLRAWLLDAADAMLVHRVKDGRALRAWAQRVRREA